MQVMIKLRGMAKFGYRIYTGPVFEGLSYWGRHKMAPTDLTNAVFKFIFFNAKLFYFDGNVMEVCL